MSIKCGKCGKINENVEGKCSECGEFLYQFFVQEQKKAFKKKLYSKGLWMVAGLVLVTLVIFGISKIPRDSLKPDLKKYLTQLKNAEDYISNSPANNDMLSVVYGTSASETSSKKKTSILDKYKALLSFYSLSYDTYSKITPTNQAIYEIHNMIVEGSKLERDALDNFIKGAKLGYITDIKETKDGGIGWSYSRYNAEYSDNFTNFRKKSGDLHAEFKRKLEQLCEAKGLMDVYGKIYPYDASMKNKITDIYK